jgi:hypothetical protein
VEDRVEELEIDMIKKDKIMIDKEKRVGLITKEAEEKESKLRDALDLIRKMRNEREEIEKRLLKETEENIKLKADEMLMSDELSRLRLELFEPKRDNLATLNSSLDRKMIRTVENVRLFDLKSNEYKSYLKGSKLGSQQNSCSNRKINKNSNIV